MIAIVRSASLLLIAAALALPLHAQEGSDSELTAAAKKRFAELDARFGELQKKKAELRRVETKYAKAQKSGDLMTGQELGRRGQKLSKEVRALEATCEAMIDPTRKAVDDALEADPKNVGLLLTLSKLAGLRGERATVLSAMDRAVEARPDDVNLRLERGLYAYETMDWKKAIGDFEFALKHAKGPAAAVARTNFVRSLVWTQQFDRAATELEKDIAAERHPGKKRSLSHLLRMVKDYQTFWPAEQALRKAESEKNDLPRVKLVTSKGDILLELFENEAPNTVASFIKLVESGFYDGTRFHRQVPQFMIQGGCPHTRDETNKGQHGRGHPGYMLPDELHSRARLHFAGSLTMANGGRRNTNGSQFMLTYVPAGWLNVRRHKKSPPTGHTVFGRVLTGLDVLKKLQLQDELEKAVVLRKRGHDYPIKRKFPVGRR